MARILAISSQVASGHVGLSAMVPALQALGHDVIALPTVLLANHPGQQPTSGMRVAPDVLLGMLATLGANGRLGGIDAVLSGYLPSVEHVGVVVDAVRRCKAASPALTYLCDPVIGDDPKGIYIDEAAAQAIKTQLLPLADIVTPNRFELAWLARREVDGPNAAIAAANDLARPLIVATSIPDGAGRLATLAVTPKGNDLVSVSRHAQAPNGTGDLLAALFLAGRLEGKEPAGALTKAVLMIDRILASSAGQPEMALIPALAALVLARGTA
jgi:pyridoxine kinase